MRKGIIMEQHRRHAVIMGRDGYFYKVKMNTNKPVGTEVEFNPEKQANGFTLPVPSFNSVSGKLAVLSVIFFLISLPLLSSLWNANKAYAYVNIDINPSIEVAINDDMRVMDITPLNDEAEPIIQSLENWENETIDGITLQIITESNRAGYMTNQDDIVIGVSYAQEQRQNVIEAIKTQMDQQEERFDVTAVEIPADIYKQAKKDKVSANYVYAKMLADENKSNSNGKPHKELNITEEDREKLLEKMFKPDHKEKQVPNGQDKGKENKKPKKDKGNKRNKANEKRNDVKNKLDDIDEQLDKNSKPDKNNDVELDEEDQEVFDREDDAPHKQDKKPDKLGGNPPVNMDKSKSKSQKGNGKHNGNKKHSKD
ncbi:anti-sigma-I factor RsgI family protein [Salirhabdus salicampi]|uniref:anti-sigma-I factor RsgI family protein n=1 Tax=Salirhabdus salicampi TaxID=476102 RepID=UPI0020C346C3|nr:hypothetical protein [Salirhabdus salicampi]MCP8615318.1 hypothetical protein [Salirhabdus salicampi]